MNEHLRELIEQLSLEHQAALADVIGEVMRAYDKWGAQPHPWMDGDELAPYGERLEAGARYSLLGQATWAAILSEEVGEALVEREPEHVRGEVIQVGAMAIAALAECPDLRAS